MKYTLIFILLLTSWVTAAQNIVDLDVTYVNTTTQVETGQLGAVLITVTNPTAANISADISKSFNYYSDNSQGAFVSIYNPQEPQITDACQWHYGAYSPWPSWTDGITLNIRINDIPPMSSVTCEGEYLIGMVDGEQHTVEWILSLISSSDLLDNQADNFSVGPLPLPVNVPTIQWWSNLLIGTFMLLISLFLLPRYNFSPNKR